MKNLLSWSALLLVVFCAFSLCKVPAAAQDRPKVETNDAALLVFVFDKSCKVACSNVRPIIQELQTEYTDRVHFVELDVSKDCIKEAQKTAKSLGIANFLSDTEDWYPAVGVFSARRKLVKQILGAKSKEAYKAAIEKAIAANR